MAKQVKTKVEKYSVITTPSAFGSHSSMIVGDDEIAENENLRQIAEGLKEGVVLLKDDVGYYITYQNRLDNGMCDPRRYSSKRIEA